MRKKGLFFGGLMACVSLFMAAGSMGTAMAGELGSVKMGTKMESEGEDDTFRVAFPSDAEHVFDFIMDPQKLISQTDAAAYGGDVFEEDATLFFRRRDGKIAYSSSSDRLAIINMGTADVDIVLDACISWEAEEGIVMTDDDGFTGDTDTSLYLALTDGTHTVAIDGEEGAFICTTLPGRAGEDDSYSEYHFWLIGAANENGDWSEITGVTPEVTVTWNVALHQEEEESLEERDVLAETEETSADEEAEGEGPEETGTDGNGTEDLGENETGEEPEGSGDGERKEKPEGSGENGAMEKPEGSGDGETKEEPEGLGDGETKEEPETSEGPEETIRQEVPGLPEGGDGQDMQDKSEAHTEPKGPENAGENHAAEQPPVSEEPAGREAPERPGEDSGQEE